MSVGGPQIPQNQQNIGHSDPVQKHGQDTGKIKLKKSLRKQIGHQLAKLLPNKAKKLFTGHRSVQALHPKSVEATPGLKDSPVKLLSVKPLSERNPQPVDVQTRLVVEDAPPRERRDSISPLDSGIGEGDNLSIHSTDSYASIRSDNSDEGYDSIKFDQPEFIDDDNGYMTTDEIQKNAPPPQTDLEDEDQYALVDERDKAPDTPVVNEESGETTETTPRDEESVGISKTSTESVPDEPTISGEDVLARKFAAYEQLLDDDDFGALEKKLANTNNYQTTKKVAQLALEKQGKTSLVFMIAQNRMQELKADQLFDQLGGFGQGADYDLVRQQAVEAMNQSRYSPGYQARVMELVDQKLDEYREVIANAPPPVPPKSEELVEELEIAQLVQNQVEPETRVEDAPPPLPPRSETPTKTKKRRGRMAGFFRRGR